MPTNSKLTECYITILDWIKSINNAADTDADISYDTDVEPYIGMAKVLGTDTDPEFIEIVEEIRDKNGKGTGNLSFSDLNRLYDFLYGRITGSR